MKTSVARSLASDGAVLVRVPVADDSWAALLPTPPAGHSLTVSAGHPSVAPCAETVEARGYRFAGVLDPVGRSGRCVDIMVPGEVRTRFPDFVTQLTALADRVFDLRMGPVLHVLAAELALHREA